MLPLGWLWGCCAEFALPGLLRAVFGQRHHGFQQEGLPVREHCMYETKEPGKLQKPSYCTYNKNKGSIRRDVGGHPPSMSRCQAGLRFASFDLSRSLITWAISFRLLAPLGLPLKGMPFRGCGRGYTTGPLWGW